MTRTTTILFTFCLWIASSQAWAQTPEDLRPRDLTPQQREAQMRLIFGPQALDPLQAPLTLPRLNPLTTPQGASLEGAQRKLVGAALLGVSVPMFVYGLQKVSEDAKWVAGRDLTTREASAALFGGALNASQGALMLFTDSPEAKARAHINLDPKDYRDPIVSMLHIDAIESRKARQTTGVLVGVGGVLAGALITFLPVPDNKVDRRVLLGAGLATALASAGAGAYLYNAKTEEEELFEAALERQATMRHTQPRREPSARQMRRRRRRR